MREGRVRRIRRPCDVIRPAVGDEWDGIDASRPLGHIVGYIDLDVTDLVDLIIDTINKEL